MRRLKVLFLCVANSVRSQMAEAFARAYGGDFLDSASAGVACSVTIDPMARQVMRERSLSLDSQFSKGLDEVDLGDFDLVINMSGLPLPSSVKAQVRAWSVADPVGGKEKDYRRAAANIEELVIRLIQELRQQPET